MQSQHNLKGIWKQSLLKRHRIAQLTVSIRRSMDCTAERKEQTETITLSILTKMITLHISMEKLGCLRILTLES